MRGAGRGVVNGASCLLEFEAGGRARRRGGAGGEVGGREKGGAGERKWQQRPGEARAVSARAASNG